MIDDPSPHRQAGDEGRSVTRRHALIIRHYDVKINFELNSPGSGQFYRCIATSSRAKSRDSSAAAGRDTLRKERSFDSAQG